MEASNGSAKMLEPRSFKVKLEGGEILRRNRRDLRLPHEQSMKFEEGEESDWLNDEDSSNVSDSDKEKEEENEQDEKQDEDYQDRRDYVTRSGRISQQPKRYGLD